MHRSRFAWVLFAVVLLAGSVALALAFSNGPGSPGASPRGPDTLASPPVRLAITIDDLPWIGPLPDGDSSANQAIERMAAVLRVHQAPATGFVVCDAIDEHAGVLNTWAAWDYTLGNHSAAHRDLNNTPVEEWVSGVERCDHELQQYGSPYTSHVRYPMLHRGDTREKRSQVESALREMGLEAAPVTVDNPEWILTQAHAAALAVENAPLRRAVGRDYLRHISKAVEHADRVARRKVGRSVPQVLLLHANTVTADYLDALLVELRRRNVEFIGLDEALADPVYSRSDAYAGPKGLSWLYRMEPASVADVEWDDAEAAAIEDRFADALSGSLDDFSRTRVSWANISPRAPDGFDDIVADAGESARMRSLLVMHRGDLVAEGYFNGAGPESPANLKSVTKSLSSALVGVALRRGWIDSVSDPIRKYLPERIGAHPDKGSITIRELLTMSTGLRPVDYGTIQHREDWVGTLLARPVSPEKRGMFQYDTPVMQLLTALLRNASGMPVAELAENELLGPLGSDLAYWRVDGQGLALGGNDAYLRPRDLIRLGELYRRGGTFDGERLLPDSFVRASVTPQIDPGLEYINHGTFPVRGYGYLWWLLEIEGEAMYAALGHGGQVVLVAPERELVAVVTSRWPAASSTAHYEHLTRILVDRVIPRFRRSS